MDSSTITLTFGDQAENHVGMQKIGHLAKYGFTTGELKDVYTTLCDKVECELINLNESATHDIPCEDASILIIRKGVNLVLDHNNNWPRPLSLSPFHQIFWVNSVLKY